MPQAGVIEAQENARPVRAWIDFGVDESWESAPARPRDGGGRTRASSPGRAPHSRALPAIAPNARIAPIAPIAPARPGAAARAAAPSLPPASARRTVQIRGRGAEAYASPDSATRPRRPLTAHDDRQRGASPDRMALWAVLLGVVLVLVAATSSHAATLTHRVAARPVAAAPHTRVIPPRPLAAPLALR